MSGLQLLPFLELLRENQQGVIHPPRHLDPYFPQLWESRNLCNNYNTKKFLVIFTDVHIFPQNLFLHGWANKNFSNFTNSHKSYFLVLQEKTTGTTKEFVKIECWLLLMNCLHN